ncbi:membrane-associated protein, putative [Bodo saltans]|uniref:Membrane-associated protein, putative n=1 Tax=Bodo saltans TaxID=75058 RepID=A0A0S4JLL9_BODSA|nr:membrane-associated protein, putative [Bodo saltans]|eukprot:CUG92419.1 membrane-associated protein, putative [Bodo saltans]
MLEQHSLTEVEWFDDALRRVTPTSMQFRAPVFTPWALLWGHRDRRMSTMENLYFYGPQLTTLLLLVLASNVAFHIVEACVLPPGSARNLSLIAVACGTACAIGIKGSELLLLPHRVDRGILVKKAFLAIWMLGIVCWSSIGAARADVDSCFGQPASSCRRAPAMEAPTFLVLFAWMKLAHPRWLILQGIASIVLTGSTRSFLGATASSANQSIIGSIFYGVFEAMAAVAWWLSFRPTLEAVIALRRTDKALEDARYQVTNTLTRLVPDVASCESIVWYHHWVARATGDSLLMLCHVVTSGDAARSPVEVWTWRDNLASHFGDSWATLGSTGTSKSTKQLSPSSRGFLACSIGDTLYSVWECPENESLLVKETKVFLKHVQRFHGGLARLNALPCTKTVLHRGFTSCVCLGTRSMAPILLGSAGVEVTKAITFAPTECICSTSTFVPQARQCAGWSCSEPIATFSTPLNDLTLDLVTIRATSTDVSHPKADVGATTEDQGKKPKGDRKAVTIVVVPDTTAADPTDEVATALGAFLELAHRHPSVRLQSRTGLARRAVVFSYDELDAAVPSLVVPVLFRRQALNAKWAFVQNSFFKDCAYVCFIERILALVICVVASCGLAVTQILKVNFESNRSIGQVALTIVAAALDFCALFSSLDRVPTPRRTLITASLYTAAGVSCFISFVLLDDVNRVPTLQQMFMLRMGCFVHGLPHLGVQTVLSIVSCSLFIPTIIYGLVFAIDRVGVTLGFLFCSALVFMDAIAHEASIRLSLVHTHLTSAAAEEASELTGVMRACLCSVMGRTLADETMRSTLPIRRCRRFDCSVVLAVSMLCPLQNRTPCRQNPILGLTERHSLRTLLDEVAAAHGVELLTTCLGDVVCYVDYFGSMSGPQLNTRRIKGRFLRKATTGGTPYRHCGDTAMSNARFMAELWASMLVAMRSWSFQSTEGSTSIGQRAGGTSLSQWSQSQQPSTGSASSPSANSVSSFPQVCVSAAIDVGAVCSGVSAVGPNVLSLTTTGAPLQEVKRLMQRSSATLGSSELRVPSALSPLIFPEATQEHKTIRLFATRAAPRVPPHASYRVSRNGSATNSMGLIEIACEADIGSDCTTLVTLC